jgi:hypothetical protein
MEPMPSENQADKNPLTTDADFALKLAQTVGLIFSAVLGILYIIGLLVSNFQLMEIGIADFTSLQARNIMIGFAFCIYIILLICFLSPLCAFYIWRKWSRTETSFILIIRIILSITIVIFALSLVAQVEGTLLGFIYAWGGRQWAEGLSGRNWQLWTPDAWQWFKADFSRGIEEFLAAFWYPKIVAASLLIVLAILSSLLVHGLQLNTRNITEFRLIILVVIFYTFMMLPLLLSNFADEVYPNIKYNFGGGQPNVAEVQIATDKSTVVELPGIGTCCPDPQSGESVTTDAVVVWYQSEKFLYLAPLIIDDKGAVRLVALDIKLVRSIRYFPKSIRVTSGGRIVGIFSN